MRRVGKTQSRLCDLLLDAFPEGELGLSPEDIIPERGYWTHRHQDVQRWQAYGDDRRGHSVYMSSWNTMTECVRRGIRVFKSKDGVSIYDVYSKLAATSAEGQIGEAP